MSELVRMSIWAHVPVKHAIVNGKAAWGFEEFELSDANVASVPHELREELAEVVELSQSAARFERGRTVINPERCLTLASLSRGIEDVIDALRERVTKKREAAIEKWIHYTTSLDDCIQFFTMDDDPPERVIVPELWALRGDPRIDARIETALDFWKKAQLAEAERAARAELATKGLTDYAKRVPALSRAANDGYSVHEAALENFIKEIASFDEDAEVLRTSSERYKRSKMEERRAPELDAFAVSDALRKHIDQLPHPENVQVALGRIQKLKLAFQEENGKWRVDAPCTVVPVTIDAFFTSSTVVIFVAEKRSSVEDEVEHEVEDEIPF